MMEAEKTRLQTILESGIFSVSAEIGPPMSADADFVRRKAQALVGIARRRRKYNGQPDGHRPHVQHFGLVALRFPRALSRSCR